MDCLVTGGAGFIGSNLVDALLARGDRVAVIDNLSTGKRENLEDALAGGAILHEADIRDAARGGPASSTESRPEVVFHLAAQIDVRHSVADPADDAESNVLGTIAVLEAAREVQSRRVVFSSTGGGLYGDADVFPTPEDSPIRPMAPYGQSKLAAEGYCGLYTRLHGLSTVSLRYGNVYGPAPGRPRRGRRGRDLLRPAGRGQAARPCSATAPRRATGSRSRDVVRANLLAADSDVTGPINIGHGQETSVLDLLDGAARGQPRPTPGRAGVRARSGPARCSAAAST